MALVRNGHCMKQKCIFYLFTYLGCQGRKQNYFHEFQNKMYQINIDKNATLSGFFFRVAFRRISGYSVIRQFTQCPNVSTTPLRQWGFRQCLPFSWTTLRGKHCRQKYFIIHTSGLDNLTTQLLYNPMQFFKTFSQALKSPDVICFDK